MRSGIGLRRGVTVLELLVVIAIIGIVTALGISTLGALQPRMSVSVATQQFMAMVGEAQARALSSQRDTWLIVYASSVHEPATSGGFVIYEAQPGFDFGDWSVAGGPAPQTAGDRIGSTTWLRTEGGENKVAIDLTGPAFALSAPFTGSSSGCSFCTAVDGEGVRGALVFQPDGQVSFVNGAGTVLANANGVLTLRGDDDDDNRLAIAVSAAGLARTNKP